MGRRLLVLAFGVAAKTLGCAESEPDFGNPGTKIVFREEDVTGGGDAGGGAASLFPNAYDPQTPAPPARSGNDLHKEKAKFEITPTTECMGCHAIDKAGATAKWAFAGYAQAKDGTPLANGDVIVKNGGTVVGLVKTASDGFFWSPAAGVAAAANAKTAVRDRAGTISRMQSPLGGIGNCNSSSCHAGGAGKIDFK